MWDRHNVALPLGRWGARVASRQSPILRDGRWSVSVVRVGHKNNPGSAGVEDLEGVLEVETFSGTTVDLADVGA
jgi:hypothetical protein